MNYDHFYTIGDSHVKQGGACEDFAMSGQYGDDFFYAAVSDGCGGALANTDIGARATVCAFKATAQLFKDAEVTPAKFTREFDAQFQQRWISDNKHDNIATLVGVFHSVAQCKAVVYGDGAILARKKDGSATFWRMGWEGVAYYPFCRIDSERAFLSQQEYEYPFTVLKLEFAPEGQLLLASSQSYQVADVRDGFWLDFDKEDFLSVSVFSDGVQKVWGYPEEAVALALSKHQSFRGGFVKQLATTFLSAYRQTPDAYLGDDLAVATLHA